MSKINLFSSMEISASGLSAQRARMNVIARNIANATTTRTDAGGPYRRQEVLLETGAPPAPAAPEGAAAAPRPDPATGVTPLPFSSGLTREAGVPPATLIPGNVADEASAGVRVAGIQADQADFPRIYDPGHPDADAEGYVRMPNVNLINEMVDMMMATRAYEANLAAMNSSRDLLMKTLTLGKS